MKQSLGPPRRNPYEPTISYACPTETSPSELKKYHVRNRDASVVLYSLHGKKYKKKGGNFHTLKTQQTKTGEP
jgi:hypothetical protein